MPISETWKLDDIPAGYVRVSCTDPNLNLVGLVGPESPRLTGGYGGWDVVNRPRQVGMTIWKGVDPYKLEFQMILNGGLDGWQVKFWDRSADVSQEPVMRDLLDVARGNADHSGPGIVKIEGIPSLPADRWVIDDIKFGTDSIRRKDDFHRIRQTIDFTMIEYMPPTYLPISKRSLNKDLGKTVVIKVKGGDTPQRIARRRGCKWTDLRRLNPGVVKKASQTLKSGTRLRVPAAEKPDRHKKNPHK